MRLDVLTHSFGADLNEWFLWLEYCGRVTLVPIYKLALQRPYARFGSLPRALRCKDCGKQPQRLVGVADRGNVANYSRLLAPRRSR